MSGTFPYVDRLEARSANSIPLDPIEHGDKIFARELGPYGNVALDDCLKIEQILRRLLDATKGLVILDFLDTANWSGIEDFTLDPKSRHLRLTWRDYRKEDLKAEVSEERQMSRLVFPASYYGMLMHLDVLRLIRTSTFPLLALKGFALTERDIQRLLRAGAQEFEIRSRAFSAWVIRKMGGLWELIDCHSFALYTALMLPKNCGLTSHDSKGLLYLLNLDELRNRLARVQGDLENTTLDRDRLCDAGNAARRLFEATLKIEALFREIDLRKPYSQLLLGDLIGAVKPLHDDELGRVFGVIAELSNKVSHDTGKPVERAEVVALAYMVLGYIEMLRIEVESDIRPSRRRKA